MAVDAAPISPCRLRAGSYLGEISALCFLPVPASLSPLPLLLAGTGSQLLIYNLKSGTLLRSFFAFQGIRVHGITLHPAAADPTDSASFTLAVFGERRVKLFRLKVDSGLKIRLDLVHRLPGFDHWALDVCFLKDDDVVVVGLSDNSVALWDSVRLSVIQRVRSPEKTLLYCMRMWGDSLEALQVASGTIYNEILIWKLSPQTMCSSSKEHSTLSNSTHRHIQDHGLQFVAIHLNKLIGHEGSIFRISWSSDGTEVVSVSDDRRTALACG